MSFWMFLISLRYKETCPAVYKHQNIQAFVNTSVHEGYHLSRCHNRWCIYGLVPLDRRLGSPPRRFLPEPTATRTAGEDEDHASSHAVEDWDREMSLIAVYSSESNNRTM